MSALSAQSVLFAVGGLSVVYVVGNFCTICSVNTMCIVGTLGVVGTIISNFNSVGALWSTLSVLQ